MVKTEQGDTISPTPNSHLMEIYLIINYFYNSNFKKENPEMVELLQ